jgi:hypothetical protein
LSGRQKGDSTDAAASDNKAEEKVGGEKKAKRQKAGDIGRALRSIYDDTVREAVPNDFQDLLGKLS